jgi:hypothetical protein
LHGTASFFEYLIEADLNFPGARETAYAILYFASQAIDKEGLSPLSDWYYQVLVQIEEDKGSFGWFSADVFIKEGRFLQTDPLSKIREQQIDFFFKLLADNTQAEKDRIYAVKMLGRMGAVEQLPALTKVIARDLKAKRHAALAMNTVKVYFDLCEKLDLTKPKHQAIHKKASLFLKGVRDLLTELFTKDLEMGKEILVSADLAERDKSARDKTLCRAKIGRRREITELSEQAIALANTIKSSYYKPEALANIASALAQAGLQKDMFVPLFEQAIALANTIEDSYYKAKVLANIAPALAQAGHINWANSTIKRTNNLTTKRINNSTTRCAALAQLATAINQYTNPTNQELTPRQLLAACVHTRVYAVLGMAEEATPAK